MGPNANVQCVAVTYPEFENFRSTVDWEIFIVSVRREKLNEMNNYYSFIHTNVYSNGCQKLDTVKFSKMKYF